MKKLALWASRFGSPYPVAYRNFAPVIGFGLVLTIGLLIASTTAFAQATVDVGGIYGAWQPYLLAVLGPVVAMIVGVLAELARRKFNLDIEASHRDALQTAITNGAGLALNRLGNTLQGKTIGVGNAAVAAGVNYVLKGAPDALRKFGLSEADVARMIEAKLPQVANTTTPVTGA